MMMNKVQWKEFWLSGTDGIFQLKATASGIDGNKLIASEIQTVPYISRSDSSNGIKSFVSRNQQKKYKRDSGNCITIGLDTQTVFYQPHSFFTGQNIQVLRNEKLTENAALFLVESIRKQMDKFNWGGNGATLGRLSRIKIMLPVDKSGKPDFAYMESTIEELKNGKFKEYREYISKELSKIQYVDIPSLDEKEWTPFSIMGMFYFRKGNQKNMNSLVEGNIPLISAKKINNGLKTFVQIEKKDIFKGHCITLNNDGDGGAGLAFYQPACMAVDSHVTSLCCKEPISKYSLLFLSKIISQQADRFGHAHSITESRLKSYKLILPVDSKGNPDYRYMEQYIKNIFYKKYKDYLDFKEKPNA